MSGPCPTLDSLIALGFERRDPCVGSETVGYKFTSLDLVASHVMNLYGRYIVSLRGVLYTGRTVAEVESQIPNDLESPTAAAAWVSYALRSHRSDLEPLPDWLVEGERHWDLIPFVGEARERERAYEASPKCFIDRDYARLLRRNLVHEISWLTEESEMTFSFDGRVLSIEICGRVYEVLATGDSWPSSYRVVVSRESKLPARFMSSSVDVIVLDGHLRMDGLPLGPCEAIV